MLRLLIMLESSLITVIYKRIGKFWCITMQSTIKNILFMQGLLENRNDDSLIDTRYPNLIVIDDLMRDATNSKDVCALFIEGSHHRNISVACILQNGFSKG